MQAVRTGSPDGTVTGIKLHNNSMKIIKIEYIDLSKRIKREKDENS